jgi:hypothetical protein
LFKRIVPTIVNVGENARAQRVHRLTKLVRDAARSDTHSLFGELDQHTPEQTMLLRQRIEIALQRIGFAFFALARAL